MMSKIRNRLSLEVRDRAVRIVGEHRADYGSERESDDLDDIDKRGNALLKA